MQPDRRDLLARVAFMYYVEDLTQSQIAKAVGLSRMKVQRLLSQAKDDGIVQIRITHHTSACLVLEQQLRRIFPHLREARVTMSPRDPGMIREVIGRAAAERLESLLHENIVLGTGWGRTLLETTRFLERRRIPGIAVVSLLGGLVRTSAQNPYEITWKIADTLGGEGYYLPAPTIVDSVEHREMFLGQPSVNRVLQLASRAHVALVSIGDLGPDSTMLRTGLLTAEDVAQLRAQGAVGDVLGQFFDRDGNILDIELNRRSIALPTHCLPNIPWVIGVAGGTHKIASIIGALRAKLVNCLITDEETARGIIDLLQQETDGAGVERDGPLSRVVMTGG